MRHIAPKRQIILAFFFFKYRRDNCCSNGIRRELHRAKWKPHGWALVEQTEIHFAGWVEESSLTITWLPEGYWR